MSPLNTNKPIIFLLLFLQLNTISSAPQLFIIPEDLLVKHHVEYPTHHHPHPVLNRGIWDFIGNWIQQTNWLPIQFNVPQTFAGLTNNVQGFFSGLTNQIQPFLQNLPQVPNTILVQTKMPQRLQRPQRPIKPIRKNFVKTDKVSHKNCQPVPVITVDESDLYP